MRKLLVVLLTVVLAVVSLAMTIGVIGKSVHPYWSQVEQGVKAAGKALGVDTRFFVPQKEDINAQLQMLESFIAQRFDGIAIAPSDPTAVMPTIKKALEAGIPVITLDTDSPESGRYVYIGTDNYQAGYSAGLIMRELLNGRGKIVIGTGSLTAMNSLQRIQGFKDAIAGTEIQILDTLNDEEDGARAVSLAESALNAHPDLDAFFGVYAYNGPSQALVVKNAGKAGKIKIVCFDTTTDILQYVKEGVIQATMGQRPYMMGYLSVVTLYLMSKTGVQNTLAMLPKVEAEGITDYVIDTGVDIVTPQNLSNYLETMEKLGIPIKF
ncbi:MULTISPECIES: sugar-binding protein [Pseudothermotoga]|jgi:ribose transport system substrate-binding protein|uniref:Periplasmic binding protein/LacI transcriptional regulator n=1 Tax=Pseudothermotoga lettingae (strain ATCC BAA-301 / DSM 14385 / NBRC 107922 / TMO) TaxID=416591 RepID=A8F443_PSELT|nr:MULTISPECIES: sugar-binding protein [Pseudothermotoga]ABV32927.1 periplasmic binding protein/LacI transcriptional regulator [Pseudothermotoga lettingae TMO]KUK21012.1 MAG: Periplasmic binding protein/LacI transcriptional regulator [Pseudothermotoga lettingae]MDI3495796.1 ribose transport system substrate-binding protein [Pseudothermotoga sp.]GLI48074.1 sugar ABC transporter substrate-binding protein [Pseudothermotoga lettingae TMO]HBJ81601.1 sugar ABC transporter substrate-binding protein [